MHLRRLRRSLLDLQFTFLTKPSDSYKGLLICVESTFLTKNKQIKYTNRKPLADKTARIKTSKTKIQVYL